MRKTTGGAAAAAVMLALLAACGGSGGNGESKKLGPQVATDAANALQHAGAVHVKGTVTSDGQQVTLDLQLQGDDAAGTLTEGGQTLSLTRVNGRTYTKASAAFYSSQGTPSQAAALLDNRWVLVPAAQSASFDTFTLKKFVEDLRKPTDGGPIADRVTTQTLNGTSVVVATQQDGSELLVAATGTPYPLRLTNKGAAGPGTVDLSNFGAKTVISPPPSPLALGQPGG